MNIYFIANSFNANAKVLANTDAECFAALLYETISLILFAITPRFI